jgi:putative addiction module component (TIGR02574 family)
MVTPSPLIDQALALPLEERIQLAEALWQSISDGLPADSERDALNQAAQRANELSSGKVVGRTHAEVMAAARKSLECD